MTKPMMILIAGPYRSGTGDDPAKMAANLKRLEEASWPIFEKGHVPMIGEWVALPIWERAGGQAVGDALYSKSCTPRRGGCFSTATRCCGCRASPRGRTMT